MVFVLVSAASTRCGLERMPMSKYRLLTSLPVFREIEIVVVDVTDN